MRVCRPLRPACRCLLCSLFPLCCLFFFPFFSSFFRRLFRLRRRREANTQTNKGERNTRLTHTYKQNNNTKVTIFLSSFSLLRCFPSLRVCLRVSFVVCRFLCSAVSSASGQSNQTKRDTNGTTQNNTYRHTTDRTHTHISLSNDSVSHAMHLPESFRF